MEVSEIIKKLKNSRINANISLSELSKKTGIAKSTLQRYETGTTKKIPLDAISIIEKALSLTPGYIMGWDEKPNTPPIGEPLPPMHKIPILGTISAGLPLYAEQNIEGYTYTEHNGGAEYFGLYAKGDSMTAAHINEGDILVVRRQEKVENGEIAVVRVGDDTATVKRFKQNGSIVQLIPQSYNPIHQIQIYDLKKENITIIGKVVECKIIF